jgi:hypothetical protein
VRTSDAPCRVLSPRGAGSDPRLEGPRERRPAWQTQRVRLPGGPHHARPAGAAAGLGRRTRNGPERLPSDRPGPRGPGGRNPRALITCTAFTPHPVACHEPGPPRQRPVGRFRLSHRFTTASRPPLHGEKDASLRLLQPTYDTSTPRTVRFPSARSIRARGLAAARTSDSRRPAPGQWPRASPRVELRLTANLQLQRDHDRRCVRFGVGAPRRHVTRAPRDPSGASIESSFAQRLPAAAFSSACRARGAASDVLCRGASGRGPTLRSSPTGEAARFRFRRRLVKDGCFSETRTPSLDECSLPRSGSCRTSGLRRRPTFPGRGSRLPFP